MAVRGFLILLLLFSCYTSEAEEDELSLYKNEETSFDVIPSQLNIALLKDQWSKGNNDAGGELCLARAIGFGVEQDLTEVLSELEIVLPSGAARAYTTFALLLRHNLTQGNSLKEERENEALINYVKAAVKGDPLAQMIVGEHYLNEGDCQSALNYFYKAGAYSVHNVLEMEVSRPSYVRHIWDEDNEIPKEAFLSQDQLDFFEYVALNGETEAALKAASFFISGTSTIKRDFNKAKEYLVKAVEGNSTIAMVWLAQMYIRNIMEGEDTEAMELLNRALKYGNDLAHSGIGRLYMEGRGGVDKNYQKAEYHFKKGIESGNIDSYYQLGRLYYLEDGPGTIHQAAEVWLVPASLGHVHAAWALAEYYRNNFLKTSSRTVISSDSTEISTKVCDLAASLYRNVAQAGEWLNLFDDAYEDYISTRKGAALLKYLLLSDMGYSAAHTNAARLLDEGGCGVYSEETARERAFEMWDRASKVGVSKGHVRIGDYLYYGKLGTRRDYVAAADRYRRAYVMGDPEGTFSLAYVTEWGEGVERDANKAENLYNELIKTKPEAEAPATLALLRLKLFLLIKDFVNIDLHSWNWTAETLHHKLSKLSFIAWDVWLMGLLVVFILIHWWQIRR